MIMHLLQKVVFIASRNVILRVGRICINIDKLDAVGEYTAHA